MSIEDTNKIDLIGINKVTGVVTLAVSDHLPWDDECEHLLLLQDKLNSYLRFVESGEIFSSCPKAKGRKIQFEIVGAYPLPKNAESFFNQIKLAVADAGFDLQFRHRPIDE